MNEIIKYQSDYFYITEEIIPNRKTPIYNIINNNNLKIGQIKWYGPWRKFCFYPYPDTIWDSNCLQQLLDCMNTLNKEYKLKEKNGDKKYEI